jgi:hypothetical protein
MNMVMREVQESLKRRKAFTVFIMLGVLVFLTTVTVLFLSYIHILEKEETVSSFEGLNVYPISDTLAEANDWREYLNEPDALDRVKRFYTYLEEDLNETYIYTFDQSIALSPDEGEIEEQFLEGYEDGTPQSPITEEDGRLYYPVKAVQMNEQAEDMFPVTVSDGTPFTAQDFYAADKEGVIPVLLGADYADLYQVGDMLQTDYLFKKFQLEVKGFVDPGSFVVRPDYPEIYLDRYIVMPAQQFEDSADEEELRFQEKHYFQTINGAIYSAAERDVVEKELEQAKTAADFPHTAIIGYPTTILGYLFDAIAEQIHMILTLSVVLLVVCVLSISIMTLKKIHDNYKNMMIHLISGGTMKQLFRYIWIEVIVLAGIPGTLMMILFTAIFGIFSMYILFITACLVTIILLSTAPVYLQFRKIPISRLLKREE